MPTGEDKSDLEDLFQKYDWVKSYKGSHTEVVELRQEVHQLRGALGLSQYMLKLAQRKIEIQKGEVLWLSEKLRTLDCSGKGKRTGPRPKLCVEDRMKLGRILGADTKERFDIGERVIAAERRDLT